MQPCTGRTELRRGTIRPNGQSLYRRHRRIQAEPQNHPHRQRRNPSSEENKITYELAIQVQTRSTNVLASFPYSTGQQFRREESSKLDNFSKWLIVDLGNWNDLTTEQARFLNPNGHIEDFKIRPIGPNNAE